MYIVCMFSRQELKTKYITFVQNDINEVDVTLGLTKQTNIIKSFRERETFQTLSFHFNANIQRENVNGNCKSICQFPMVPHG